MLKKFLPVLATGALIAFPAGTPGQVVTDSSATRGRAEGFLELRRLTTARIAPDGGSALLRTRSMDVGANLWRDEYSLVSLDQTPSLASLPGDLGSLTWGPNSRTLTYVSRSAGCSQLWSYEPLRALRSRIGEGCLGDAGTYTDLEWSPNGRYLAYLHRPPRTSTAQAATTLDQSLSGIDVGPYWVWGCEVNSPALEHFRGLDRGPGPPQSLWVYDRETGQAWSLSPAPVEVKAFEWSPDGTRLAYAALASLDSIARDGAGSAAEGYDGIGELFLTGIDRPRADPAPVARIGRLPGYVRLEISWAPNNRDVAIGSDSDIYVYRAPANGSLSQVIRLEPVVNLNRRSGRMFWDSDGTRIYTLVTNHLRQSLYAVGLSDGIARDLLTDLRWYDELSVDRDHRRLLLTVQTVTEPPRLFRADVDDLPRLEEVLGHRTLNPQFAELKPLHYDTLSWMSRDGRWQIHGVWVGEQSIETARARPLVTALLGAAVPANLKFGIHGQLPIIPLVRSGYTVLVPNTRGRHGFGEEFLGALATDRTYFSKPWEDVEAGVDALIARGVADPQRLGLIGFSYGGALAAFGITQTGRYQAAILKEASGIDLRFAKRSFWGIPGNRDQAQSAVWGLPIESPYDSATLALLDQESPIEHVDRVHTPTLLEFGVKNINATYGGNPFFQALQYFGVASRFMLYPRTAHAFEEPALLSDSFDQELKWFDRWIHAYATGDRGDSPFRTTHPRNRRNSLRSWASVPE